MLRVLSLADEICDGISVPEESTINVENFKSSFKINFKRSNSPQDTLVCEKFCSPKAIFSFNENNA